MNGTIIRSYISYLVDSGRLEAVEIGKKALLAYGIINSYIRKEA